MTNDYRMTLVASEELYKEHLANIKKTGLRLNGVGAKTIAINSELFNNMLELIIGSDEYNDVLNKFARGEE